MGCPSSITRRLAGRFGDIPSQTPQDVSMPPPYGGERDEGREMTDDGAPDRDPGGVAGGATRAARRREGAHAPGRRARPPAPGAALGTDREGVRLRDGQ